MATRIAINGFGRIGRLVFRNLMEEITDGVEVVALNDVAPLDNLAYLLRHDSIQPTPTDTLISVRDHRLVWNDRQIRYSQITEPEELPWDEAEIDLVIESSGHFTSETEAKKHLDAGARRVLISAPAKGDILTLSLGVNEEFYDPGEHFIISNASCTTNALAPVAKVLDDNFGIVQGALTTVHAYTNSQTLVDGPSKKWRRGRSAAHNIVPTTTGAAIATTKVLPQLKGKMDGMAIRVPVLAGSIIDFVATTREEVTIDSVNRAFHEASRTNKLGGILGITNEELVSSDIIASPFSSLVDANSTMTFGNHMVKVLSWYDNEWAYARRTAELARYLTNPPS